MLVLRNVVAKKNVDSFKYVSADFATERYTIQLVSPSNVDREDDVTASKRTADANSSIVIRKVGSTKS